ncbi:MAG: hypothetical protein R3B99_11145 [Polyangiales bacterium]
MTAANLQPIPEDWLDRMSARVGRFFGRTPEVHDFSVIFLMAQPREGRLQARLVPPSGVALHESTTAEITGYYCLTGDVPGQARVYRESGRHGPYREGCGMLAPSPRPDFPLGDAWTRAQPVIQQALRTSVLVVAACWPIRRLSSGVLRFPVPSAPARPLTWEEREALAEAAESLVEFGFDLFD